MVQSIKSNSLEAMEQMVLDRTDFGILRLLQNDAGLSNKQIAAAIGLAPSSAHERL